MPRKVALVTSPVTALGARKRTTSVHPLVPTHLPFLCCTRSVAGVWLVTSVRLPLAPVLYLYSQCSQAHGLSPVQYAPAGVS